MDLLNKLDELANEKEKARAQKDMYELISFFKACDIEGLDGVVRGIQEVADSSLYEKLLFAYKSEAERKVDRIFEIDELKQVPVLRLARENLHFGGFLNSIFTHSLVTSKQFIMVHLMIKYVYVIFSGRNATWNDNLNIFFSGLDENIIFALDDFDKVEHDDLPEPTQEYFQKLKKIKWENKKSKQLYDKLTEFYFEIKRLVLNYPDLSEQVGWITTYRVMEDLYIQTLAGCNAVNNDRLEIKAEDVIIAYKTFLKLLKTDVTKYKAIPERLQGLDKYHRNEKQDGYLICNKCGGYYKLKKDESSDDFDTCRCGGRLKYKKNLED